MQNDPWVLITLVAGFVLALALIVWRVRAKQRTDFRRNQAIYELYPIPKWKPLTRS